MKIAICHRLYKSRQNYVIQICHNDVILKYLESRVKFIMEEELKAVKNSLSRVADTLERIEGSRSGPGMSNFFEWCEH